jgi:hypothetical protein
MTAKYDPDILQQYADRLYKKANSIVVWDTIIGVLAGIAAAMILVRLEARGAPEVSDPSMAPLGLVIVGIVLGYIVGSQRAFTLRLEAQRTLCQMQIEHNTRPSLSTDERPNMVQKASDPATEEKSAPRLQRAVAQTESREHVRPVMNSGGIRKAAAHWR